MPAKLTHDMFLERIAPNRDMFVLVEGQQYAGMDSPLLFLCTNGHGQFETRPRYVLTKDSGCPVCGLAVVAAKNATSTECFLKTLHETNTAVRYVSGYQSMSKKATFECSVCSHQWETLPKTVVKGSGCPECSKAAQAARQTYTHEQFLAKVEDRNKSNPHVYVLPNQLYTGANDKLKMTCDEGHVWSARPGDLWNNNAGCPQCAGTVKRSSIEAFGELHKRWPAMTVTSEHFDQLGRREQIDVVCEDGHEWTTTYERLMAGHYCPHCYGNAKLDHQTFEAKLKAVSDTIQVLGEYEQSHQPVKVRCTVCEHVWKPRPYNLLNGYGCPTCSRNNKFSKKALVWLQYVEKVNNITIQHAMKEGEFRIPGTKYRVDGYDDQTNTVYEFYGDYWHGNPEVFSESQTNVHLNKTFGDLYKTTLAREQALKALGYTVVSIWESEFDKQIKEQFLAEMISSGCFDDYTLVSYDNRLVEFKHSSGHMVMVVNIMHHPDKDERYFLVRKKREGVYVLFSDEVANDAKLVRSKLQHYSNSSQVSEKINARQCEIRSCSVKEKAALLNANHVQHSCSSAIDYGAYYNNQLVAVMTFSPPRIGIGVHKNKKPGTYELVRFCTDVKYRIPGIASKLLKHFQRNHEWSEIYSYADKRWSDGNMYFQLGFELIADNPPDYFYIDGGKRKHRWNYRKDLLKQRLPNFDPSLTEYQNMQNHGYWRVWDCGTLKFSMTNTNM